MAKLIDYLYEIIDEAGEIVDVMDFASDVEAQTFMAGTIGGFTCRRRTLAAEDLLEVVINLRAADIAYLSAQVEQLGGKPFGK